MAEKSQKKWVCFETEPFTAVIEPVTCDGIQWLLSAQVGYTLIRNCTFSEVF